MVDWADDLKKKLGQNTPPSGKEEDATRKEEVPESVFSSVKEAGEAVQEGEKQLEKLAEKKARLLESISKKVETLKALVSQAGKAAEEGLFAEASALWKQVLELDPQNADAQTGLESCRSHLADMASSSKMSSSETPVIPEPVQELRESVVSPIVPVVSSEVPAETVSEMLPPDSIAAIGAERSVEQASMPQNELDSLLSQISETAAQVSPAEAPSGIASAVESQPVSTPSMSSSELNQVLAEIQGDPVTPEVSSPVPEPVQIEKIPAQETSAPAAQAALPEEDEGAKELEAVLNEVNKTQMQSLVESPPQVEQTEVMGGEAFPPEEAATKEVTAKLAQIKTAVPAGTYQAPAAASPATVPASRRNWILGVCVVLLAILVGSLVCVVLSMFETSTPQVQKNKELKATPVFTVEDALLQAKKYLEAGKVQDALKALLQIKDVYPTPSKMVEDWLRAAQVIYDRFQKEENPARKKELGTAVTTIYEQVIDQFPRDEKIAVAYYRVAESYSDLGAYSRAFTYYDALIKYYPDFQDFEEAVYARARMLLEQDKFQECREAYLKILKDFPQSKMAKWAELDIAKSYKMEALKGGQGPV